MEKLHSWEKTEVEQMNPLLTRQLITGEQVMLARIVLKKGCVVPTHHHHNEQVSSIIEGALEVHARRPRGNRSRRRSSLHSAECATHGRSPGRHACARRLHAPAPGLARQNRRLSARKIDGSRFKPIADIAIEQSTKSGTQDLSAELTMSADNWLFDPRPPLWYLNRFCFAVVITSARECARDLQLMEICSYGPEIQGC